MIRCEEISSSDSRRETSAALGLASDKKKRSSASRVAPGNRSAEEGVFPSFSVFSVFVLPALRFGDFGVGVAFIFGVAVFARVFVFLVFADVSEERSAERFFFFFGLAGPQPPVSASSASPSNA